MSNDNTNKIEELYTTSRLPSHVQQLSGNDLGNFLEALNTSDFEIKEGDSDSLKYAKIAESLDKKLKEEGATLLMDENGNITPITKADKRMAVAFVLATAAVVAGSLYFSNQESLVQPQNQPATPYTQRTL